MFDVNLVLFLSFGIFVVMMITGFFLGFVDSGKFYNEIKESLKIKRSDYDKFKIWAKIFMLIFAYLNLVFITIPTYIGFSTSLKLKKFSLK